MVFLPLDSLTCSTVGSGVFSFFNDMFRSFDQTGRLLRRHPACRQTVEEHADCCGLELGRQGCVNVRVHPVSRVSLSSV
jgi:hypothetical protein